MMDNEKQHYNRIKIVLAEKRKKNKELALHMGVALPTVSKWCTNTHQPSIPELYKIASFLGVTAPELLEP